jgi:hypothetical protein
MIGAAATKGVTQMQRPTPLTGDTFLAALNANAARPLPDIDVAMELGRRAARYEWTAGVLAAWLASQPTNARALDVASGVLLGIRIAGEPEPLRVVTGVLEGAHAIGVAGLGEATTPVAFVAVRALDEPRQPESVRAVARDLLEDLLAHADGPFLQPTARSAARDALERHPPP